MIYINPYINYSTPTDYILCYNFNGNYNDKSVNALHGIKTGTASFGTGLKGLQCLDFTAGCVKTPSVLPVNSDQISLSFFIKTTQSVTSVLLEMSATIASNNAFNVIPNNTGVNTMVASMRTTGIQAQNLSIQHDGTWRHIVIEYDRKKNTPQISLYVNGLLASSTTTSFFVNTGNFVNNILFIGQRNASTFPFVGSLQNLKIYNRLLKRSEILGLKKELL